MEEEKYVNGERSTGQNSGLSVENPGHVRTTLYVHLGLGKIVRPTFVISLVCKV